ncbi:MAG: QueT transporter family protein [Clostridia bacterium]|nr:QueT transporter family protein [Clostridia bacterium]
MNRKRLVGLTRAAVIAALYAVLTYVASLFNLAYGPVQFRISEVLTILPIFTFDAVPGLAIGCFIGNLLSTVGWVDLLFGTAATLIAAVLTRRLRGVRIFGLPIPSALMPVISNAVIVGLELTLFLPGVEASLAGFAVSFASVGLGELVICLALGLPFWALIEKNKSLKKLFD